MVQSSGWTSRGVSDKRLVISVDENRTGMVLVDDSFLSRTEMRNRDNDMVTIGCEIRVLDNEEMYRITPHPHIHRRQRRRRLWRQRRTETGQEQENPPWLLQHHGLRLGHTSATSLIESE